MKTYTRYSEDFKELAMAKFYSLRNDQTIKSLADDLNISLKTLKKWIKKTELNSPKDRQPKSKRPADWPPEDRLDALHKAYGLTGEALNAWCREQGVFVHQLEQWKADFCSHSSSDKRQVSRYFCESLSGASQLQ